MTARILPFATRERSRRIRERRIDQAPDLRVETEGVTLTITAERPIDQETDSDKDLRPNFRD